MQTAASIAIDSLAYGMVLFIISIGLSVTMGLMRVINLAHGAFAMIGGYAAALLTREAQWSFWLAVPAALVVLCLAIAWFLAALGVYLRDITQVTPLLSLALLFLSTAMMPLESVPDSYRWVFEYNPLSFIIDQARAVLLWQQLPDAWGLLRYLAVATGLAYLGRFFFAKARSGFADVL